MDYTGRTIELEQRFSVISESSSDESEVDASKAESRKDVPCEGVPITAPAQIMLQHPLRIDRRTKKGTPRPKRRSRDSTSYD